MKKIIFSLLILILIGAFSCKENKILSPEKSITQIELDIQGLGNLGSGFWYELWVLYEEGGSQKRQSAGIFTVDDNGALSKNAFDVNLGYLQMAKGILVSIEEDDVPGMYFNVTSDTTIDTIKAPSKYRILSGTLIANDGELSVGNEFLLNFDFSSAAGSYMLATPTDSSNTHPEKGLWFVSKDTNDAIIKGLDLPDVPGTWSYNGRLNNKGTLLYTGTFTSPGGADNLALYSDSTGSAYPFPGEDFIFPDTVTTVLPNDLRGLEIGIVLTPPYPEKAKAPFTLIPLKATIPANAVPGQVYQLENNSAGFPSGQFHAKVEIYD